MNQNMNTSQDLSPISARPRSSTTACQSTTKQILRKVKETEQIIECIFKQAIMNCKIKIGELYKEIYFINHQ